MKSVLQLSLAAACTLASAAASASYSADTGSINTIWITPTGGFAFLIEGGFSNAASSGQCPAAASGSGFASFELPPSTDVVGNQRAALLKSAVVAAKAAKQTVKVIIQGCNGGHFLVKEVYFQ
jgi:hypothetical protein